MSVEPTTVYCPANLRAQWPSRLASEWLAQYPQIFDADDLRLAQNQPQNHFNEWFVAIHLFHRDAVHSLVEKYLYANHPRKRAVLERILTPSQLAELQAVCNASGVQPPDLFLYYPVNSRFYFAEVKGPNDRLSVKQVQSHQALSEHFNVPVYVFKVAILSA